LAVDASLDLLMRWSLPAQAIYVSDATAAGEDPIDLMPVERRVTKLTSLRMINLGLLGLVIVLSLAAIAIPILQKRQVVVAMLPMVENAKQQATTTDALRREWDGRSAEYNFVLDKKQSIPPVVVQLDELARLLPDDTWVQQFDLRGKELQIQGETASSSKLIALVESARMMSDASFRSPLTKGSLPNSERFHLAAVVKPLQAVAPVAAATAPVPGSPAAPASAPAPAQTVAPGAAQAPQPAQPNKPDVKPNPAPPIPNQLVPPPVLPIKPSPNREMTL
jgi:Tfp pilus assembly protein PilN